MSKTILAVDDSHTIRRAIELTFLATDFEVVTASGEHEALDRLENTIPDVVLVDAGLEDGAGYRLAGALRSRDPTLPVIFLTSSAHAYDPGQGQRAGVGTFVDKPFQTEALIEMVHREVEQRPATPPEAEIPPVEEPAFEEPAFGSPDIDIDVGRPEDGFGQAAFTPSDDVEEIEEIDIEDVPDEPLEAMVESSVEVDFEVPEPPPDLEPEPAPPPPVLEPEPPPPPPVAAEPTAAAEDVVLARASDAEPILQALPADELRRIAREVLERVAWEVVPDLAETIIREELTRLTSE